MQKRPHHIFFALYQNLKYKLSGGALYISLLLCISVGTFLALIIMLSSYNQRSIVELQETDRFYMNLKSGVSIARSSYFSPAHNNTWLTSAPGGDSLRINRISWGAFDIISVETKNNGRGAKRIGLYGGSHLPADTGLFISESNRQITIMGPVDFRGKCFLPKYRKLSGYQKLGSALGNVVNTPGYIPQLQTRVLSAIREQAVVTAGDSMASVIPEYFSNSFKKKTIVYTIGNSRLTGCYLDGNIKIIADELEVDSSCKFNNILVVCKKVRFNTGFKGKVHVVASDSISAASRCSFHYPSSFVLLNESGDTKGTKIIRIGDSCMFSGAAIACDAGSLKKAGATVFIQMKESSVFNGLIYSNGYLQVAGTINGTAFAEKLIVVSASSVNENQMSPCTIDPKKYAGILPVPSLFDEQSAFVRALSID